MPDGIIGGLMSEGKRKEFLGMLRLTDEEIYSLRLIAIIYIIGSAIGLLLLYVLAVSEARGQDKKPTIADTLAPVPEIVLIPRVITGMNGQHHSVAIDDMPIPKDAHVKVAIVVFAWPDAKVESTRSCKSAVTKAKKNGTTTTSSESVSTDTKVVGKTGILLAWRQLAPSEGGVCTLTVKLGTVQKAFTVKGRDLSKRTGLGKMALMF
ncbi:hypothetical protein HZB94_01855 [Candidatus Falkowbacteria bacterium]|nr:hypothetical protein [Candidatus Falkowbacteria bacterium]